ncbi:PAS domain-containing sensor histidine kinase [Alicyclobacillus cellulosilyticus]|uniref:histidine kinase n=1 Tax=Alicyclobacillus cellulosilyticus TaxID=1003997 RepID=A0A917K059_9BACL|nr:ATP-binding protein [Alicyclobacillus cellulosilyticus]GGI95225.1 PAS domain-containing sensor histidine kinase [Alicyclobacillus cellulosilyticus]
MWRSVRSKLVTVYLLLIVFTLELIGAFFVHTLTTSLIQSQTASVSRQAQLLATIAAPEAARVAAGGQADFTPILHALPQLINGTVYVLNKEGVVEDTSAGQALIGQKRIDSVATQALVQRQKVAAIRYDPLAQQHLLAVAVPMFWQDAFVGLVEYVVPVQETYNTVRQVTAIFYTASLIALAMAALFGFALSETITKPVREVTALARKLAGGDFTRRVEVHSDDEFGQLAVAINDLTEKLQAALAASARERERLQAVIKHMRDGVIAFDDRLEPVLWNDAALAMLPGGAAGLPEAARHLGLAGRADAAAEAEGESRQLVRDGPVVHVLVSRIEKGSALAGYVAVLRDVTDMERLNRARRDFVANVSHELKTPLTSIRSHVEALLDGPDLPVDMQAKFLHVIRAEADRMTRLTQDLLQLSAIDAGGLTPNLQDIEVERWLRQTVQRFSLQAERGEVSIHLTCPPDLYLQGDRDMLDRVMDNLLSNALKFTPPGGRITVAAHAQDGGVAVVVSDTGQGIPPEDLPHVFDRFYRVEKSRNRRKGGSGLGLALVREMVKLHGGRVWMESVPNEGTTVTVWLPERGSRA